MLRDDSVVVVLNDDDDSDDNVDESDNKLVDKLS